MDIVSLTCLKFDILWFKEGIVLNMKFILEFNLYSKKEMNKAFGIIK